MRWQVAWSEHTRGGNGLRSAVGDSRVSPRRVVQLRLLLAGLAACTTALSGSMDLDGAGNLS